VGDEPEFLANYSDGLSNLPLPVQMEHFRKHDAVASFVSVKPNLSYHLVSTEPTGWSRPSRTSADRRFGSTAASSCSSARFSSTCARRRARVVEPFQRLVGERRLTAYEYDGFWMSMDTFKDRQQLEDIYSRGGAPWESGTTAPCRLPRRTPGVAV
jgi:glucose-1-phosphate cytidylyltransferase